MDDHSFEIRVLLEAVYELLDFQDDHFFHSYRAYDCWVKIKELLDEED